MPKRSVFSQHELRNLNLTRRGAAVGGGLGIASLMGASRISAQTSTPEATPVGTPGATPAASPAATPEPIYPLTIIDEQRPQWVGTPQPGGEIRLFIKGTAVETFTPTLFQQDFQVSCSYLDPLFWIDEVTMEPRPWIATEWDWAEDGLSLEIEIRSDVTWNDGSPLTADDVQFSLLAYRDDYDSAVSFMLAVVADVEVTDKTHLIVRFDEPDGTFPFNAGNLPVFSKAQYEAHWTAKPVGERTLSGFDYGDSHPVGSGPWQIDERSSDGITLLPNAKHFGAVPLAEKLTLIVEDDPAKQVDAWKQDNADLVWPFDGTQVEGMLNEDGSLVVADSTKSMFMAFNFGNPNRVDPGWMATAGLREALNLAINRVGYAEQVFGGLIDVERAGIMTQPWAIDASVKNPKRDLETAMALLAEGGWGDVDGDGVLDSPSGDRGAFVCIVRDDEDPKLLAALDTLNADFNEVGFALEVQRLDVDAFTARWTTTFDYDLIASSLNQYAAFTEFDLVGSAWSIRGNAAGWNPGGYWNPEVDDAILSYLQAWKIDDMKAALGTIQRATNEDLFALWLGFPKEPVLVRPDISGFQPNKMWQSWNTWSLWHGQQKAEIATPAPATPVATPAVATPAAATPGATPVASPVASPVATPTNQ